MITLGGFLLFQQPTVNTGTRIVVQLPDAGEVEPDLVGELEADLVGEVEDGVIC